MTSNSNSKTANSKHTKVAKSQRQYVRGIIHNLSLQRWTSQEISDYLHGEKKIDIARSTVNSIRRQIEKQAEKWYIELRQSRYKYIANYKERIDSLLSYQKKLNQIVDRYLPPRPNTLTSTLSYPDTIIKAISELHKIEISIFSLWKQLPNLDLSDPASASNNNGSTDNEQQEVYEDMKGSEIPPVDEEDERNRFDTWDNEGKRISQEYRTKMEAKYGLIIEPWTEPSFIQCKFCLRWFENNAVLYNDHWCIEKDKRRQEIRDSVA